MYDQMKKIKFAGVIALVAISILAISSQPQKAVAAAADKTSPFQVNQTYSVGATGTSKWRVKVLEAGSTSWIKVRNDDGDIYWLNTSLVLFCTELPSR